jgi:SAM-dependent methyltransferase
MPAGTSNPPGSGIEQLYHRSEASPNALPLAIDRKVANSYNRAVSEFERDRLVTEMTPAEWDEQYARQAEWTRAIRTHLYRRANLLRASGVLDVGSGTGVVTEELAARTRGQVIGIDYDPEMVAYAKGRRGKGDYRLGDAHDLPFDAGCFDVTVCHFLLLWCRDPAQAAAEMVRVTRPGGAVLVCAEPDYGGRLDYPDLPLRAWQIEALRQEGADPCLGRKLRALFALPAVRRAEVGLIPGLWDAAAMRREFEAEWALWQRTLEGQVAPGELARVKAAGRAAIETGERLIFVPVFFAMVQV